MDIFTRSSFFGGRWLFAVAAPFVVLGGGCGSTEIVKYVDECPPGYTCVPTCSGAACQGGVGVGGNGASSTSSNGVNGSSSASTGSGAGGKPDLSNVTVLDYRVVDAEISNALSSIVMVSDTPSNALHIYDMTTGMDRSVTLPAVPTAVSVEASGLVAAVAYDAHVSWVDLQAGAVTTTCAVSSNAYDLVVASNNVAYVMPKTDQWVSLHVVDPADCSETLSTGPLYASSRLAMHPSDHAVFAADQGLSPSRIDRCDVSTPVAACEDSEGQADWGTYDYCGNLWLSADGSRIYSACGATLRVPGDVTSSPCSYGGSLPGVTFIQHLTEAPQVKRIALIPGVATYPPTQADADTVVRIHETDFLSSVSQVSLPGFPLPNNGVAIAHGRFVFSTPSMDTLYVIVQADPSSGAALDFAVTKLTP